MHSLLVSFFIGFNLDFFEFCIDYIFLLYILSSTGWPYSFRKEAKGKSLFVAVSMTPFLCPDVISTHSVWFYSTR